MAALNKCNPAQLLILHIIKFLIYTLCFHGPTHNSLVLNSWVVKTNTLDKCWSLYLLFFGWQFSFSLPQSQTPNSTLRKLSDLVCLVYPLPPRKTSEYCSVPTDFTDGGRSREWEISSFFSLIKILKLLGKPFFFFFLSCGRISNTPWSQNQKWVGFGAVLPTVSQNVMYQVTFSSFVFPSSRPGVAWTKTSHECHLKKRSSTALQYHDTRNNCNRMGGNSDRKPAIAFAALESTGPKRSSIEAKTWG